jgi:uncharacterized membrane protein YccC
MNTYPSWQAILPVSSAIAALVSAFLVYRFTHRQSLRSNAERWLECVRDDVAELIAVHAMAVRLRDEAAKAATAVQAERAANAAGGPPAEGSNDEIGEQRREWEKQREMLHVRLRLRLTRNTRSHKRLIDAVTAFLACDRDEDIRAGEPRHEIVDAACAVVGETWDRIKAGYSSR